MNYAGALRTDRADPAEPGAARTLAGPQTRDLLSLAGGLNASPRVRGLNAVSSSIAGRGGAERAARAFAPQLAQVQGTAGLDAPFQLRSFGKDLTGQYGDIDTSDADDIIGFLESCRDNEVDPDKVDSSVWAAIAADLASDARVQALLREVQSKRKKEPILFDESQLRPSDGGDAIAVIKKAALESGTRLGGASGKKVYLFGASGQPADAANASYMVDPEASGQQVKYAMILAQLGITTPHYYGNTDGGKPIMQWIRGAKTVAGNMAKSFIPAAESLKAKFPDEDDSAYRLRWGNTLADVQKLIDVKYGSPDFQFMIARDGHLHVIDLEENNTPYIDGAADPRLVALRDHISKVILGTPASDGSASSGASGK